VKKKLQQNRSTFDLVLFGIATETANLAMLDSKFPPLAERRETT
jgi:hypothetical protein